MWTRVSGFQLFASRNRRIGAVDGNVLAILEGFDQPFGKGFGNVTTTLPDNNLTHYPNPPLWEMMKVGISEQESKSAYDDWIHSPPPAVASIIRDNKN